jgi:hypothetical protein
LIFSATIAAFFGGVINRNGQDGPTKYSPIDPDTLAKPTADMSSKEKILLR